MNMNYKIEKLGKSGWAAISISLPRKNADKRVRVLILRNPQERYRLAAV